MTGSDRDCKVTLRQYALVTAGVADGIALEALLEFVSISANRWAKAELVWSKRMVDDLAEGCRQTLELDALQQEAREIWRRPIPPLDDDLKAWLDFQRTIGEQDDPSAYLESIPLGAGDLGMLQRLWTGRMASDPQLVEQAAALLAQPADPVTVPPPPPAQLPISARRRRRRPRDALWRWLACRGTARPLCLGQGHRQLATRSGASLSPRSTLVTGHGGQRMARRSSARLRHRLPARRAERPGGCGPAGGSARLARPARPRPRSAGRAGSSGSPWLSPRQLDVALMFATHP